MGEKKIIQGFWNRKQGKVSNMKVTLARALKEKKRIAGRINTLEQFIRSNNVYEVENKELPSYKAEKMRDVQEKLNELAILRKKMVETKEAIAKANAENGICGLVYEMEECKSEISFYRQIDTIVRPRSFENNNGQTVFIEKIAQIPKETVDSKIEELTKAIEKLQDKVDEINATVFINIPNDGNC